MRARPSAIGSFGPSFVTTACATPAQSTALPAVAVVLALALVRREELAPEAESVPAGV